jgi:hypothetical protein
MHCVELYADEDGESHFRTVEIDADEALLADAAAKWRDNAGFRMVHRPADRGTTALHNVPSRRLAVVFSGGCELGASDGEVRRFTTGDLILLTDTTGKGHTTGPVGDEDFWYLFIRLTD